MRVFLFTDWQVANQSWIVVWIICTQINKYFNLVSFKISLVPYPTMRKRSGLTWIWILPKTHTHKSSARDPLFVFRKSNKPLKRVNYLWQGNITHDILCRSILKKKKDTFAIFLTQHRTFSQVKENITKRNMALIKSYNLDWSRTERQGLVAKSFLDVLLGEFILERSWANLAW